MLIKMRKDQGMEMIIDAVLEELRQRVH